MTDISTLGSIAQDPVTKGRLDRLGRMMKRRIEASMLPRMDDRGRVLFPGLGEREATRTAWQTLPVYLANYPDKHQAVRDYIDGKTEELPDDWTLRDNEAVDIGDGKRAFVVPSDETWALRGHVEHARQTDSVGGLLPLDVVDTAGKVATMGAQLAVDVVRGGINFIPGVEIPSFDVFTGVVAGFRSALNLTNPVDAYQQTQDELDALRRTRTGWVRSSANVVETAAMIRKLGSGLPGAVLHSGAKVGGAAAKVATGATAIGVKGVGRLAKVATGSDATMAIFDRASKAISSTGWFGGKVVNLGKHMGSFAAYEGLTADPGHRIEALTSGAIAGAVIGSAGDLVAHYTKGLFTKGLKSLDGADTEILRAVKEFGRKKNMVKPSAMSPDEFLARLADSWARSGAPGVKLPVERIIATSAKSLAEGAGFSLLDADFRSDLWRAVLSGDVDAMERLWPKYLENSLAVGLANIPLSQIPYHQRRQAVSGRPQEPATTMDPSAVRAASIDAMDVVARPLRASGWEVSEPTEGATSIQITKDGQTMSLRHDGNQVVLDVPSRVFAEFDTVPEGPPAETISLLGEAAIDFSRRVASRQTGEEYTAAMGEGAAANAEAERARRARSEDEWRNAGVETKEPERHGWSVRETEPGRMEFSFDGTDYSYTVERAEDIAVAKLSPAMSKHLGLPSEVPAHRLQEVLDHLDRLSSMKSKLLPGTEVDASGIKASDSGSGDRPMLRTVRLGQVLEAPLAPGAPIWSPAKSIPARGKDSLLPVQRDLVQDLIRVLDGRRDLAPQDVELLNGAIEVLDSVSLERDQSVAEAISFLPTYMRALTAGDVAQAGKAIRALADSLTTKAPEEIVAEEAGDIRATDRETSRRVQYSKAAEEAKGDGHATVLLRPEVAEVMRRFVPQSGVAGRALKDAASASSTERTAVNLDLPMVRELAKGLARWASKAQGRMSGAQLRSFRSRLQAAEAKLEEAGTALGVRRSSESGYSLSPQEMYKALRERFDESSAAVRRFFGRERSPEESASRALGMVASPLFNNPVIEGFARDRITKVGEIIGTEMQQRFQRSESEGRAIEAELNPDLEVLSRTARRRNPELDVLRWSDRPANGAQAGYSAGHVFKESALRDRFGVSRSSLSGRSKDEIATHDRLTKAIRAIAHRLGVKISGMRGDHQVVSETSHKDVMTRQFTPRMMDALLSGGALREAFVDVLAAENGIDRAKVEKILESESWTEARGIKRVDPIEVARELRFMPDHIRLPSGETVRVLETNLYRHAQRMVRGAALRLGTIKEFGQDLPSPDDGGPSRYLEMVNKLPTKQQQDVMVDALRASMGMATHKPYIHPDSRTYRVMAALGEFFNVSRALKMTLGPIQNVFEPFGTVSAMLGIERVGNIAGEVWSAVLDGRFSDMVKERIAKGGFALHKPDFLVGGEHGKADAWENLTRSASSIIMVPFEFTQTVTDIIAHRALDQMVTDMREGRGTDRDKQTLRTLFGFDAATAKAMVEQRGTDEHYSQVLNTGLARLTRRGDYPINKSPFAADPVAGKIVAFTSFFQRQLLTLRQAVRQMRDADSPEDAKEASLQIGRMLGLNMGAYLASQSAMKLLLGGWDELAQYWRETTDDPGATAASALVGSLLGGQGSAIGTSATALITGRDADKAAAWDTLSNTLFPIGQAADFYDFASAALARATGDPIGDGPYSGRSPLQQLGYFAGQQVPAARAALGGLFGLGVTYMGTDPDLDAALRANSRWNKKHVDEDFGTGRDTEERREFLDVMRGAANAVKSGATPEDVMRQIREGIPDAKDSSISASLLARRVMTGRQWSELTATEQAAKLKVLGPERVELLRGYDAALTIIARRFAQ